MRVRGGETGDCLLSERPDTARGSRRKLAQVCVAAGVESLLVKVGPSVPRDLLLESV